MTDHAVLGPSAAERWIACPASVRMGQQVEARQGVAPSSSFAQEGTYAHELAALKVLQAFGQAHDAQIVDWVQTRGLPPEVVDEMQRHTDNYVEYVMRHAETMRAPQVAVEVRVDTGVPNCWGTADCVLFSPWEIKVVDFKYGVGIAVEAANNPQLRLYALGVLEAYNGLLGDYDEITMCIAQPRIGIWKGVTVGTEELYRWRDDTVKPAAAAALSPTDAWFGPSYDTCRWCPAAGRCSAQAENIFGTDFEQQPDTMSPGELSDALTALPAIRAWMTQLEKAALTSAYSEGTPIPGWKVVRTGGRRSVPEAAHAIQTLIDAGYPAEATSRVSMIGMGDLEKVVGGRDRLHSILGDLIVKSRGVEALVPESDRRPAINPETEAGKVFDEHV